MENKKTKRYFDSNTANVNTVSIKNVVGKVSRNSGFGGRDVVEIHAKMKPRKFNNKLNKNRNFQHKKIGVKTEKYPGKMPIPKEILEKHSRGEGLEGKGIVHPRHLKKMKLQEKYIAYANKQAARAEILLPEDVGYLEADEGETTTQFTQKQITKCVDIATASKHFELKLEKFGPYRMRYSRNGRHLLLGGKMGHIAAFDWVTKHLHCEVNVTETVHDVCWMHIETMFAVAQKDWVYIYDNKGTELHCLKVLNRVQRMEFLPYHFLLATGSEMGYLSWLDISIGQMVSQYHANVGKINVMKQNPYNAVMCVGQANGVVSMWCPTIKKPLAKLLCHGTPVMDLSVDPKGIYMATSSADRSVRIWDIRKLEGPLHKYRMRMAPSQVEFSQNSLLAVSMGNVVEVYRDCCTQGANKPYLVHKTHGYVENLSFCPYEDILGVGTDRGFVSLIIPGSGEANFDALESNPYQTKSQRTESEVKSLLEKIQPELIDLNPMAIAEVDVPSLQNKVEAHNKLKQLKPQKLDYTSRRKKRAKGTPRKAKNKKITQETENKKFYKEKKKMLPQEKNDKKEKSFGVLDRFVSNKK